MPNVDSTPSAPSGISTDVESNVSSSTKSLDETLPCVIGKETKDKIVVSGSSSNTENAALQMVPNNFFFCHVLFF